jgi:transposase
MKTTKRIRTLLLRNLSEIKEVLGFLDKISLSDLVTKYNVDSYVKDFHTIHLIKIAILYFYSKERHLKHFLTALMDNPTCCRIFGIPKISVQQVYKALQKRCWFFFYEAFEQIVQEVKGHETASHKLFKGKEIKIIDSTFLVYALSRIFFAKIGYAASDKAYKPGIKLHVLLNYSKEVVEKFIETSGNVHDSKVADTVLNNVRDCVLLFDKGYTKLERFKWLTNRNVIFVIPPRANLSTKPIEEKTISHEGGDVEIKVVELSNGMRVQYIKHGDFELICNDCSLQWYEVVTLYSFRWEIESLFKRLKQLWKINKPLFRNTNSIMAFICITMIAVVVLEKIAQEMESEIVPIYHLIGRQIEAHLIATV